jgi:hypothetical protein
MMGGKPFKNRYCPVCLAPVNAFTGEHWHPECEYEASYGDWVNPDQPLTELEMLNRKLAANEDNIKAENQRVRETRRRIAVLRLKIKEIKEAA